MAMVALASTLLAPRAAAQTTPTAPITTMTCTGGRITVWAPTVLVGQGYATFDAYWHAELYRWTASGWRHVATSYTFGAEAQSTSAFPGSTTGLAGPLWFWTTGASGQWIGSAWFNGYSGHWYAVRNVVREGGLQNAAWATVDGSTRYCYLP